jgi:hypothetical protein
MKPQGGADYLTMLFELITFVLGSNTLLMEKWRQIACALLQVNLTADLTYHCSLFWVLRISKGWIENHCFLDLKFLEIKMGQLIVSSVEWWVRKWAEEILSWNIKEEMNFFLFYDAHF